MPTYTATNKSTGETFEFDYNGPGQPTYQHALALRGNRQGIKDLQGMLPAAPPPSGSPQATLADVTKQLPTGNLTTNDYLSQAIRTPVSVEQLRAGMHSRMAAGDARADAAPQQGVFDRFLASSGHGLPSPRSVRNAFVDTTLDQATPLNAAVAAMPLVARSGAFSRISDLLPKRATPPPGVEPPTVSTLIGKDGKAIRGFSEGNLSPTHSKPLANASMARQSDAQQALATQVRSALEKRTAKLPDAYADNIGDLNQAVRDTSVEGGAIRRRAATDMSKATTAEQRADAEWYNTQRAQQEGAAAVKAKSTKATADRLAKASEAERTRTARAAEHAYKATVNDPEATVDPEAASRAAAQLHNDAMNAGQRAANIKLGQRPTMTPPFTKPKVAGATPKVSPVAESVAQQQAVDEIVKTVPEARALVHEVMAQPPAPNAAVVTGVKVGGKPVTPVEGVQQGVRNAEAMRVGNRAAGATAPPTGAPGTSAGMTPSKAQPRFTPNEEAGATSLESILNQIHGKDRPSVGNGTLPAAEPQAVDAKTLQQLADLEALMKARGAQLPGVSAPPTPMAGSPRNLALDNPTLRTEDALRSNPRFQALPPAERASRYKQLGRMDAARNWQGEHYVPGGDTTGEMSPEMAWYLARIGGGAGGGAVLDEKHPLRGAAIGAGLGALTIPMNAESSTLQDILKRIDSARFEGMLSGGAQLTNVAGNVGSLAGSPMMRLLQGKPQEAGQLVDTIVRRGIPLFKEGFKQGFDRNSMEGTRFDQAARHIGPAGRLLRGVDRGTKNILETGGLTPREAEIMTFSGKPVTAAGKGLEMLQSTLLGRLVTPFARTAINQAEVGAAMSPLRAFSPKLRELVPSTGAGSETAMMMPGLAGLYAGYHGDSPSNPTLAALSGPVTFPQQIGHGIRDYQMHGRTSAGDAVRSVLNQIPLMGDVAGLTENPSKMVQGLATQPIPPVEYTLMSLAAKAGAYPQGDHIKDVNSITDAFRDRIPVLRDSLPDRRDFFGHPLLRNALGQYPNPLYDRSPDAQVLGEQGILRREPSATYQPSKAEAAAIGPVTPAEKSRLQELRGTASERILTALIHSPNFAKLPPESQTTLLRMLESKASAAGSAQFKGERYAAAAAAKAKP